MSKELTIPDTSKVALHVSGVTQMNGHSLMAFAVEPPVPSERQYKLMEAIAQRYPTVTVRHIGNGALSGDHWETGDASVFVAQVKGKSRDDHYSREQRLPDVAVATALAAHPDRKLDLSDRMALVVRGAFSEVTGIDFDDLRLSPDMVGASGTWGDHPRVETENYRYKLASVPSE